MNQWALFAYQHPLLCAIVCLVPWITALFCLAFYVLCGAVFGVNPFDPINGRRPDHEN